MQPPFFSVVIPTYNQAMFLKKAINSVLDQTYNNYEIIIIDNHSKDETQKVVESFNNKKILYKKIYNNGIIAKSRNEGIKLSSGEWIAFLDSDDFWYRERLKIVSDFLFKNKDYDVICTDELINDKIRKRKKIWRYGPFTKNFYEKLLKSGNRVSTSASIVKKDFLKSYEIYFNEKKEFITAEDYDFFMNLANANAKFKFFHEVLGEHLFYENSYSSNYNFHTTSVESVVRHHVFNIQKFSKNKKALWQTVRTKLNFDRSVHLFIYKKKYLESILNFLKILFFSPISTFFLIIFKIKNFFA